MLLPEKSDSNLIKISNLIKFIIKKFIGNGHVYITTYAHFIKASKICIKMTSRERGFENCCIKKIVRTFNDSVLIIPSPE